MTSIRPFPSEVFVDLISLSKFFFLGIHFVDLVVFKLKIRRYVTRGTQKVVSSRQSVYTRKVVPPARVTLPAEVRQLAPRVVSPP